MHRSSIACLGGVASFLLALPTSSTTAATTPEPPRQGAALLKTDLLGVFAHPDDETGMAATIARYAHERNAVVAHVYCTRGEGGGNMVGTHWGPSLGVLREAELRDCLAVLGVRYAYFLDQLDWAYTESAAATLEKWDREAALEHLVRLIRSLRPEVILTMNPAPNPGQHGHHQAAGILATEAFTAAADPGRYPLQLSREGLTVWQARKLYYGGVSGTHVTTIAVTEALADGRTPAQIAGVALSNHRSQAFGNFVNSPWLQRPQNFTLVKSFVAPRPESTDLLEDLPLQADTLRPVQLGDDPAFSPLSLEFSPRPAVENYRNWVQTQGIGHVAATFKTDLPLVAGEANVVNLKLRGTQTVEGTLKVQAPDGWNVEPATQTIRLTANQPTTAKVRVTPATAAAADGGLTATFEAAGNQVTATAVGHPVPRLSVNRVATAPALAGSDAGWAGADWITIDPTRLVQGRVADEADSSAAFRLLHDGRTLFVDVRVKDDQVVSNIAPNDIRGHWRSDSVEICLDPAAGAEHTLGTYKLGIFPFDSTGVVRAARDADANQGLVEETALNTRLFSRRTPDGYRVQAAIPFAEIGLQADAKRLGFNLIIYDGDKADALPGENINKSRLAWSPRPGVMGRPEDWGRIDLK
jgi:LmbE family N-acetylglucosaminyl deacetylase